MAGGGVSCAPPHWWALSGAQLLAAAAIALVVALIVRTAVIKQQRREAAMGVPPGWRTNVGGLKVFVMALIIACAGALLWGRAGGRKGGDVAVRVQKGGAGVRGGDLEDALEEAMSYIDGDPPPF